MPTSDELEPSITVKVLCPDCASTMELGFLPEAAHGGVTGLTCWVPGPPDPVRFLGLKTGAVKVDWKSVIPVTTFRCPRCGLLKSYALPYPLPG